MGLPTRTNEDRPIRWGVIGPGEIAEVFASACVGAGEGSMELVLGRSRAKAENFARRYGAVCADSPSSMMRSRNIDAVYIATPHPMHAEYVRAAIHSGIAVLCEKPLTVNADETRELAQLAMKRGVLLMEGWMYRAHPQVAELARLINAGAIGKVFAVNASFGVSCAQQLPERILAPELAGGVIYDIGGYPVSGAMFVDQSLGGSSEVVEIRSTHQSCTPRGVELDARCSLRFRSGLIANIACSFEENLGLSIQVLGEAGSLRIPACFLPEGRRDGVRGVVELHTSSGDQVIRVDADRCCYALQARAFRMYYHQRRTEATHPLVGLDESVRIARVLDDWKSQINCTPDDPGRSAAVTAQTTSRQGNE